MKKYNKLSSIKAYGKHLSVVIPALVLCLLTISCRDDDYFEVSGEHQSTILENLKAEEEFSMMTQAMQLTGFEEVVGTNGLYTVFAPTNEAFQSFLSENGYASLNEVEPQVLRDVIEYHVVTYMLFSFDFEKGKFQDNKSNGRYPTFGGKRLQVDVDGAGTDVSKFAINTRQNEVNAVLGKINIEARNGAIHAVEEVLMPSPDFERLFVVKEDLSNFEKFLDLFTLYDYDVRFDDQGLPNDTVVQKTSLLNLDWRNESNLTTLFAPNDPAFAQYYAENPGLHNLDTAKTATQKNVLTGDIIEYLTEYHMVNEDITAPAGTFTSSGRNEKDKITIAPEDVAEQHTASNGYIYELNKVKEPPFFNTVSGTAMLNNVGQLDSFAVALKWTAMLEKYMEPGKNATIFMPTNEAFVNAGISPSKTSPAKLISVLEYHILNGVKSTAELEEGFTINTQGTAFSVAGNTLTDAKGNTAQILTEASDITSGNGIVHKIDRLLLPPEKTLPQLLAERPEFSEFVNALKKAALYDTLNVNGLAIFAPTNDAFATFYANTGPNVNLDDFSKEELAPLLRYHILQGQLYSSDFETGTPLNTQQSDKTIGVITDDFGNIMLTSAAGTTAGILEKNVQSTNGVMHSINAVLLP